jgi:hypothetical protein
MIEKLFSGGEMSSFGKRLFEKYPEKATKKEALCSS